METGNSKVPGRSLRDGKDGTAGVKQRDTRTLAERRAARQIPDNPEDRAFNAAVAKRAFLYTSFVLAVLVALLVLSHASVGALFSRNACSGLARSTGAQFDGGAAGRALPQQEEA